MLELGWSEILVIAIVVIVVVGPKDLPRVLRSFGRTTAKLRAMAADFRRQFDEALREAELEDVKSLVAEAKKLDPRAEIRKHLSPIEQAGRDIRAGLDDVTKPKATPRPETQPAEALTREAAESPVAAASAQAAAEPDKKPASDRVAAKPAATKVSAAKAPVRKVSATKPAAKKATTAKPAEKKPAPRRKKTVGTAP